MRSAYDRSNEVARLLLAPGAMPAPRTEESGHLVTAGAREQAQALLQTARDSRLHAYVVLSVMTGPRTEELRALQWNEVHLNHY